LCFVLRWCPSAGGETQENIWRELVQQLLCVGAAWSTSGSAGVRNWLANIGICDEIASGAEAQEGLVW
jgi:hypothetical protein